LSRSILILPANLNIGRPALAEMILGRLKFILRGSVAGATGGGLVAAILAGIASTLEPWTEAPGPWLVTTGFAALLSMALGAWTGARGGFLTALVLLVMQNHRLAILLLVLLIGFAMGLFHGMLASRNLFPSIQLEQPLGFMEPTAFYMVVQLGAVLFTLWWMLPSEMSHADFPPMKADSLFGAGQRKTIIKGEAEKRPFTPPAGHPDADNRRPQNPIL
jgi:hypothetical protein